MEVRAEEQICAQATAEGEPLPIAHLPSTPDNQPGSMEPCPNRCEVGSVKRCNMEQHRSVCSLEPVACEMKEFGCSVVVPRKELATHMKESELQHLTAMTVLNLRLSRQLQQDSTERDRKITQLQQEMADMKKLQTEMKTKFGEQKQLLNEHTRELTELKGHIQKVQHTTDHIEQHTACTACEVITFAMYSKNKRDGKMMWSNLFYSHYHGYMFKMAIRHKSGSMMAAISLVGIEKNSQLRLPVKVKVYLELLNQTGDHHHAVITRYCKDVHVNNLQVLVQIPCHELEKKGDGISYVMDDCIKFRIHITVL